MRQLVCRNGPTRPGAALEEERDRLVLLDTECEVAVVLCPPKRLKPAVRIRAHAASGCRHRSSLVESGWASSRARHSWICAMPPASLSARSRPERWRY